MGSIAVDNRKNAGSAGGKDSTYFRAGSDSSSSEYDVTLNYGSGHWCTCRGMIAKRKKFSSVADPNQPTSVPQTSRHYCKHVTAVRTADPTIRLEARRIRNEAFGIGEAPFDPETGQTGDSGATFDLPRSAPATGRKAAIKASREAKAARGDQAAKDRLATLETEAQKLREQIEVEDALRALTEKHGIEAVKAAMEAA